MSPLPPDAPPEIPDYQVLRRIGRGSYGEVWLARGVTGVFRVIKIVRRDRFDHDRPFLRELEGITRYQQLVSGRPRQLALLHVGLNEPEGYFYYVMEPADDAESGSAIDPDRYVPLTLKELLQRRGRLPLREVVQIALELARGLAVLHAEKLIHRDIKPSNVIFTQGVPKLADVGLVALSEASMTHVGTPGYLPPEGPGSPAGDIYSLGKLIYELATGFDRNQYPRLPDDVVPGSPEALLLREINAIVLRACHPQPQERHPTADALAQDLELVQAGRSVAFYEHLRRRLRIIAWSAGAFGVASVGAALLLVWRADIQDRAREQSRRAYYRSDMAVAQLAKAGGDLGRAREALLRQVPSPDEPDLRGIEWSILNHAVIGEGVALSTRTNPAAVRKLVIDQTGHWLAASFSDDTALIWNASSPDRFDEINNTRVLGGFNHNQFLLVDQPDRSIRTYDPNTSSNAYYETGERLYQLLPNNRIVVVSRSGDLEIKIKNLDSYTTESSYNASKNLPDFSVSTFEISPDSESLLLSLFQESGATRIRLLVLVEMQSGKEIWRMHSSGRVPWIRWSPDSQHIAANLGGLRPTVFSPTNIAKVVTLMGHSSRVQDAAFSPNGKAIATAGSDQTIRVWSVEDGTPITTLRGLGRPATAVTWSPNGDQILAGDEYGAVRLFSIRSRKSPDSADGVYGDIHGDLCFSSSGNLIAVTKSTNSIQVFEADDLTPTVQLDNVFQPVIFQPEDNELVAFTREWQLVKRNLRTQENTPIHPPLPSSFSVNSWCLSQNEDQIALTSVSGEVAILSILNQNRTSMTDPSTNASWAVSFFPDSKSLLTGTVEGQVRMWESKSGNYLGDLIQIDANLQSIAISSDCRWIAISSFDDSSIRIIDFRTRREIRRLTGHRRFAQCLAFHSDGTRLISGGVDGKLIIWRVPDFEEIAAFELEVTREPKGDEGISVFRIAPHGLGIAALTEDGRIQLWRNR